MFLSSLPSSDWRPQLFLRDLGDRFMLNSVRIAFLIIAHWAHLRRTLFFKSKGSRNYNWVCKWKFKLGWSLRHVYLLSCTHDLNSVGALWSAYRQNLSHFEVLTQILLLQSIGGRYRTWVADKAFFEKKVVVKCLQIKLEGRELDLNYDWSFVFHKVYLLNFFFGTEYHSCLVAAGLLRSLGDWHCLC